jgi:sugar/nucleoside kinase (ribokinase family)
MAHTYDVAAMGNALLDVLAPADDAFLLRHNIAKGVMTLIDEFRALQLYEALSGTREIAGGSAANTAAGVASFGAKGLYVGKVKDDPLGRSFAESLSQTGVQYTTNMAAAGPATGCCLIAVTPDGQRSMSTFLGASSELAPGDIDEAGITASAVLYVEGYLWDSPGPKAAITRAMEIAKRAGRKVALTLSDPFCVGRYRAEFRELFDTRLDILFANEEEAMALFEVETFDEVLQTIRNWPGIAALTRSAKGCVIARGAEVHVIDAAPVAKVIDTTGAGDQFAAGFLVGLTGGKGLAECGKLGALAAAEVISHYGARPEASLKMLAANARLL